MDGFREFTAVILVVIALRSHFHLVLVVKTVAVKKVDTQRWWHYLLLGSKVLKEQVLDWHAHVLVRLVQSVLEGSKLKELTGGLAQ